MTVKQMIQPEIFYNMPCLRCDKVEKWMVKIGVIILCNSCAIEIFNPLDKPIDKDSERGAQYNALLEVLKKKINDLCNDKDKETE